MNTALITGASRGIGQAILLELGAQGARVFGTATSQNGADKISQAIQDNGLSGGGLVLDVTSQGSVDEVISTLKNDDCTPSILINNAGITRDNLFLRLKEDEWQSVIETNLTSIYRLSKACIKDMLKKRWGRIINIGSVVGSTGNSGQTNYAAAKAGLVGFSKSLAQEIGSRGITVNVIAPGFIDTDMTKDLPEKQREALLAQIPAARLGDPKEIAYACAFLASNQAGYITGETIHINGGMYMI